jgi:thiamine biosynthesis lipoprotein
MTNQIDRIDLIINPYNEKSEISFVNSNSMIGQTNIAISDELAYLLNIGFAYAKDSDYVFDIGIRRLIELWGFGFTNDQKVPSSIEIKNVLDNYSGSINASISTNNNGTKYLNLKKPIAFDLGSYGKGYILSRLVDIFHSNGIKDFLIDFGGDTYAYGLNSKGKPWVVAIRFPRSESDSDYLSILKTTNASIVTSGDYERFFMEDGKRYHHIIDGVTGYPSKNAISSTIVSSNPTDADALSTVLFLLGTNFFSYENLNYTESYLAIEDYESNMTIFSTTNN